MAAATGYGERRSRTPWGPILLWSGFSNLVLVGCFVIAADPSRALQWLPQQVKPVQASAVEVARADDPLVVSRMLRSDRMRDRDQVRSELKQSLPRTVIPMSVAQAAAPVAEAAVPAADPQELAAEPGATLGVEPASYTGGSDGGTLLPLLRRNPGTGHLEVGNFKPMSLAGGADDCLDQANALLSDVGASRDHLEVLARTKAITIARICAINGSVVVSCRGGQITVSPRRSKPNDGCSSDS